jgi:hypothetical protein
MMHNLTVGVGNRFARDWPHTSRGKGREFAVVARRKSIAR